MARRKPTSQAMRMARARIDALGVKFAEHALLIKEHGIAEWDTDDNVNALRTAWEDYDKVEAKSNSATTDWLGCALGYGVSRRDVAHALIRIGAFTKPPTSPLELRLRVKFGPPMSTEQMLEVTFAWISDPRLGDSRDAVRILARELKRRGVAWASAYLREGEEDGTEDEDDDAKPEVDNGKGADNTQPAAKRVRRSSPAPNDLSA